jgi:transposase
MKSFIRVKVINGRRYAYEVTPYYDKESKKIRQRSRYLGKYEDGEIKRVRTRLPRRALAYGEFLPFMKILEELRITEMLQGLLPEHKANTLLVLALNRATSPVAMSNVKTWYEGTYLPRLYGDLPLSSQSLSEFLKRIGGSRLPMDFSQSLIRRVGDGSPLLYDITSLSSSSRLIDLLEHGYNRDLSGHPQLNLSLVTHKDQGIPLLYDVHPGSIMDVSTLRNTMAKIDALGLEDPTLILDKGFFSATNIADLVEAGYSFILPASYASKEVKSLALRLRREIEKPTYLRVYEGKTLFVREISLELDRVKVDGFLFYDLGREKEEKALFYHRLHEVVERLRSRVLRPWEKPGKVFEDVSRGLSSYLGWKAEDGRFRVEVKDKAVSQRVNRMGVTVVLCRGGYGWRTVLGWLGEKDVIEKMFMRARNDLEAVPLRAHKTEVALGLIFIAFLSLILRSRLGSLLRETGLADDYSVPSLLLELGKIKKVELSDGSHITTEITKKHRKILKKLELNV